MNNDLMTHQFFLLTNSRVYLVPLSINSYIWYKFIFNKISSTITRIQNQTINL